MMDSIRARLAGLLRKLADSLDGGGGGGPKEPL